MTGPGVPRAEAVVDLSAIRRNTELLLGAVRRTHPAAGLMAAVKADGYGHGAAAVARAAIAGGATALGVAYPSEGVALVGAGVPVVAWLWGPGEDIGPAIAAGVHLVVSSIAQLDAITAAAPAGYPIHLKADTGLGRGGSSKADLGPLVAAAAAAERSGAVRVVGLMSHLANGDLPDHESVRDQLAEFRAFADLATAAGLDPAWRHLANTPGALLYPETRFELIRAGIGLLGIDPLDDGGGAALGLRPAMTLRAGVALVKRVPAGQGISYGHTHRTATETTLALVPLGYGDGIPRAAGNRAQVLLGGRLRRIAGRVAMDQFVVEVGDDPVHPGDEVILFGPGDRGEPTANDWGTACDTIGYEIVTRIGPRVPRRYVEDRFGSELDSPREAPVSELASESSEPRSDDSGTQRVSEADHERHAPLKPDRRRA